MGLCEDIDGGVDSGCGMGPLAHYSHHVRFPWYLNVTSLRLLNSLSALNQHLHVSTSIKATGHLPFAALATLERNRILWTRSSLQ